MYVHNTVTFSTPFSRIPASVCLNVETSTFVSTSRKKGQMSSDPIKAVKTRRFYRVVSIYGKTVYNDWQYEIRALIILCSIYWKRIKWSLIRKYSRVVLAGKYAISPWKHSINKLFWIVELQASRGKTKGVLIRFVSFLFEKRFSCRYYDSRILCTNSLLHKFANQFRVSLSIQ